MEPKTDVYGWHFAANDRTLGYKDGRLIEAGVTHWIPDKQKKIKLCKYGLHASVKPLDALQYAQGSILSYCRMLGDILHGDDKMVAEGREYIYVFDAEPILREFARWCALQAIHLWDAPDVVKQYMLTGDMKLRAAARDAAWEDARAARAAAWEDAMAARDAARAAAWEDAWEAAREAAWEAARAARAARAAAWEAQNTKLTEMLQTQIA